MEKNQMLFRLMLCKGIGNQGIQKLIQVSLHENHWTWTPQEVIQIAEIKNFRSLFLASWQRLNEQEDWFANYYAKHKMITILDEAYPALLKESYNAPTVLFYQGDLKLLQKDAVAVVGAREAHEYGKCVVKDFVHTLSKRLVIVSGLAKGIDRIAHEETIKNGGRTIGVIGCGLDIFYPRENEQLQKEIAKNHLLLSEYPLGVRPNKHHFPMRNRIIAGLTLGTCVVEAKVRSGSLITAQIALENGREVFAVPGDVLNKHSNGCHLLIQDGAKCTFSAEHIIEEIRPQMEKFHS